MAKPRYLRDGKAVADLKIVTRKGASVDWFRELATKLEVPHGAVFDAMIDLAKESKRFERKVKVTWHDSYAL